MKKASALILALSSVAGAVVLLLYLASGRSNYTPVYDEFEDMEDLSLSDDFSTIDWEHYYGDTLYQYDNRTICLKYGGAIPGEGVESSDASMLITLTDSVPTDTCLVGHYSDLRVKDDRLVITVGPDTLRVNLKKLPNRIDPAKSLMIKGFTRYAYRYDFALSDSSFPYEYYFQAYLPQPVPVWTKQFIATILNEGVRGMYEKRSDLALQNYYGMLEGYPSPDGFDPSDISPEKIAAHYARLDSRLYSKEYGGGSTDTPGMGPKYDYMLTVTPMWVNSDTTLITYRIYSYNYCMGAHGMPEEFYLTFNASTGKILGWEDVVSPEDYNNCIVEVGKRMTDYKSTFMELTEPYEASLGEEDLYSGISSVIKEKYRGKFYPRPALTNNGILFSYQPYEAGSFAEGILHFLVPYDKVTLLTEASSAQ